MSKHQGTGIRWLFASSKWKLENKGKLCDVENYQNYAGEGSLLDATTRASSLDPRPAGTLIHAHKHGRMVLDVEGTEIPAPYDIGARGLRQVGSMVQTSTRISSLTPVGVV